MAQNKKVESAAGGLSLVKLMAIINKRRSEPERKRIAALFPNGEKAEIIGAIDEIRQQMRDNHRDHLRLTSEHLRLTSVVSRLAEAIGIDL